MSLKTISSKIKELRGDLSQDEFADKAGIPRSRVSEGEGGKSLAPQIYFLIGNFAAETDRHSEAIFFWELAGLKQHLLESVVLKTLKGRTLKAKPSDLIRVPLHKAAAREREQKGASPQLLFPASLIHRFATPSYVRIGYDFQQFRRGDLLLIDESEITLSKLEGSYIAYMRRDDFLIGREDDQRWREKVQKEASKEELEEALERATMPFEHVGIFAGWLRRGDRGLEHSFFVDAPSRLLRSILSRQIGGDTPAGDVVINSDLTILGRVLAWVSSPGPAK